MMNKFRQEFHIPCYNTDMSWRLKPSSFMDLAQEAANLHAVILGFGYDDMIASKTAWVLSRMHVVFVDTPRWRDDVTLFTWHKPELSIRVKGKGGKGPMWTQSCSLQPSHRLRCL